jgi:hypothetical protein
VFVSEFKWCCFWTSDRVFCGWGCGAIALHQVTQNLGTGGTIFLVQVALLFVSNYAFERNGDLRDQLRLKVQGRPLNLKPLYSREKVGCITSVEVSFWLEESAVV